MAYTLIDGFAKAFTLDCSLAWPAETMSALRQRAIVSSLITLEERCRFCEYLYEPSDGGTWAFTYVSSAALTGVFFVALFLIKPTNVLIGQAIVLPLALLIIGGTLPFRKGIAVALEHLVNRKCIMNEPDVSKEN